ncbi:MAG TPA: ABC transporter substrate-binding protein [Trebonia sp.]|jgi:NitT/TauT family transport system substrate-binding protein
MRKWRRATVGAAALTALGALAAGCSTTSGSSAGTNASLTSSLPTNFGPAEKTTLNVGAVPAMDSAGFFVALHDGLFAREGLTINYTPAVSSETAIEQQVAGKLDISAGNYVSYVEYDAQHGSPLEVVSEGSVTQAGAQTIFTMPDSKITTLSQLKGKLIGVNAPANIDYLLDVSVLQQNGITPTSVDFPNGKDKASAQYKDEGAIPFPFMAQLLAEGKISAATLPEPFASEAEQQYGAVPLADLNQGATNDFPIEGYVVTKAWAKEYPNTLKRFLAALSVGQELSDTDRGAVEQAFESLKSPQDGEVSKSIAAVMALDTYPIGVDQARIQRVADVMNQFGVLQNQYKVSNMLLPSSFFNFSQFTASNS